MGYKIMHIAKCECCERSWLSEDFRVVTEKMEHIEFNMPGGTSSLYLCEDCSLDVKNAIRNIYDCVKAGKSDISVRGYRDYERHASEYDDPIDLDTLEEDK